LHKTIIVVEGENDRTFFHELVRDASIVNPQDIATYSEIRFFERDFSNDDQKRLSIIEGGGSNLTWSAIRIMRPFWYVDAQVSIGVIGDSDTGSVYEKLSEHLKSYLATPCKVHVFKPSLTLLDSEKRVEIRLKKEKVIPMWTFNVPDSLEIQISRSLKKKHPKLKKSLSEDETIENAAQLLGIGKKKIIENCLSLLRNEKWLSEAIAVIKENTDNLLVSDL
jgi:hypothetical protein